MTKETNYLSTADTHKSANRALKFYDSELAPSSGHVSAEVLDFDETTLLNPNDINRAIMAYRGTQSEIEETIDLSFTDV